MKTKIFLALLLLLSIGGIFWYRSRPSGEIVPTERVTRGSIAETVSVTGTLVPTDYADISFSSLGRVDDIRMLEGASVKQGDIIATIDTSVLESEFKKATIALSIAEENEKLARRQWDDLKPEERRAKKLTTEQAREAVRTLAATLKETVLRAPLTGTLSRLDLRVGETVTAGRVVARVSVPTDRVIEVRVPESDIAKVAIDMKARITFDAFSSDEVFPAMVSSIDPASTVVQDVVSYVVKLHLDRVDERLKEGMTANIDIETARRESVLTVPFRALSKEGGKNWVEVKRGEGTFERVEVTTGLEGDEGVIEITSGLAEGDEVTIGARQKK